MNRFLVASLLIGLGSLLLAGSVSGEIYWWVDKDGNVQSTSDPAQVPPEHRSPSKPPSDDRIMIVPEIQAPRPSPARQDPEEVKPHAAPSRPAEAEKRIEGKARHQWRAGYNALERSLAALEMRLKRMEEELPRYRTRTSWNLRMERLERQIEQAEDALQAYEDRARRAGVPPGWLR